MKNGPGIMIFFAYKLIGFFDMYNDCGGLTCKQASVNNRECGAGVFDAAGHDDERVYRNLIG